MESRYTLRFPFQLPPGREISGLDEPATVQVGELTLSLERAGNYYVAKVFHFESEEAAREYLPKAWTGLAWLALNRQIGFTATTEFDTVHYAEDPERARQNLHTLFGITLDGPVDGLANGNMPTVYSSDKHVRFATTGADVMASTPVGLALPYIAEGLETGATARVLRDMKLRTALELYSAHFFEASPKARFLSLVMALEVLFEPASKSKIALDLVQEWQQDIKLRMEGLNPSSEDYAALAALESELLRRRETSIGAQLKSLIRTSLASLGAAETGRIATKATSLYRTRSKLVHNGTVPPSELHQAEQEARQLIEAVLKARLRS